MIRKIDWESQIGKRLRLRDLHVFATVVRRGSMAKAAAELGVSQPTVSEVIADLEHVLGVRLLDRSRRGVEATIYGEALLRRGRAAFDELRQGIQEIGFLTDSTTGEINIGCPESIATALVSPIVQRFVQQYPRVILNVFPLTTPTLELPKLRDRTLDLAIIRSPLARIDERRSEDLLVEILFNDDLVVAVGMKSQWIRRRKIDLADLLDEPWILTPPGAAIYEHIAYAFRVRDLDLPKTRLTTQSVGLRGDLLATGQYVAALPTSILNLYAKQFPLKALPVDLPTRPWPIAMVTLKNRTLSPVVERFIECVREVVKSIAPRPQAHKVRKTLHGDVNL
jgi:DNA-binding transcriptional LysR family regulator